MGLVSGAIAAEVNEYRAYSMGHDGHIRSSRAFVCEDDADAIVWAEQLVDGHDIELWSGERFVRRVNTRPSREDEARQVVQGYADDQREIIKKLRKPTN